MAFVLALPATVAHGASPPSPFSVIGSGAPPTVQAEDPISVEDLGRGVMAALQQGSFEALVPHLLTAEDLAEVIAKMVEDGQMTAEQAQQNASQIPAIVEEGHASLHDDYEQVQAMAAYEQVSWDEAEITGYHIIVRDPDTMEPQTVDTEMLATMEAGQMIGANISVRFAAAGNEHELSLGDCVRTSRGWVVMERFGWSDGRR